MASIGQMMNNVRLRLREPKPQAPSGRAVCKAVLDQTQSFFNMIADSGQSWAMDQIILNVTPNTADYLLPINSRFGKPFQVLTYYPQNQSYIERVVTFYELGDLNYNWGLPYNAAAWMANWDGSPNTAMRVAFYRKQGTDQIWVRFKPTPMLSAQYIILFGIGDYSSYAGMDSSPVLSQHHGLIETRSALSLLSHADWWDNETMNQNRRKELLVTLGGDNAQFSDDWERYVRSVTDDQLVDRVGAASTGGGWWF